MAETINFLGTGGIIEGNLGAANVNVNLDAALDFNGDGGTDDYVTLTEGSGAPTIAADGAFTISAWIKPAFTSGSKYVAGEGHSGGSSTDTDRFGIVVSSSTIAISMYINNANDTSSYVTVDVDKWNHIAFTRAASSTTGRYYINGVAAGTDTVDNANWILGKIGGYGSNSSNRWQGHIADVKLYNSDLSTDGADLTPIQALASKINIHYSQVGTGTQPLSWFKLNDGTGNPADSGSSGNATVRTNATWDLGGPTDDPFSVNVQDNSTTTDGNFTVTQGKLEGKALSYVHNDATDNATISANAASAIDDLTALSVGTFACWTRADNFTNSGDDHWIYNLSDSTDDYFLVVHFDDASGSTARVRAALYENGAYQWELRTAREVSLDKWHHIAVTQNGTEPVIYIDGISSPTQTFLNSTDKTAWWDDLHGIGADRNMMGGGLHYNNGAHVYEPDGDFKDFRFYNYALSADQMSSLYSGSYNVTPMHWIKCDEGSGTLADSGTDTAWTVTNTSLTYVNGTLDLDGTLTIAANGTLSAPRGTLDVYGALDINCTTVADQFIHNNGKFQVAGSDHVWTPNNAAFYDIDIANTATTTLKLRESMTVENLIQSLGASGRLRFGAISAGANLVLTLGTATSQGELKTAAVNCVEVHAHSSRSITVQGAAQLYPAKCTGYDWDWDDGVSGTMTPMQLKWLDFQFAVDTHHSGTNGAVKLELDGDCEFDAVTIQSGDTLDLNGQRMECSGTLTNNGEIDFDGMIYAPDLNLDGTTTNKSSGTVVLQPPGAVGALDLRDDATLGTLMINAGNQTNRVDIAGTNNAASATNLFVGTGILDLADKVMSYTDMNIATGATLDADSSTITCTGDFTTSGGLLGASCLTLNGSDEYAYTAVFNDDRSVGDSADYTIELWFNRTSTSGNETIFDFGHWDSAGSVFTGQSRTAAYMDGDGIIYWDTRTGGGTLHSRPQTSSGYDDSKWHHAAFVFKGVSGAHTGTYSTGAKEIWIDGKLEARVLGGDTTTDAGGSVAGSMGYDQNKTMTFQFGRNIVGSIGDFFTGSMDEVRMWSDARTQAEIRDNMFTEVAATADHLRHQWSLNEGTGTSSAALDTATDAEGEAHVAAPASVSAAGAWAGAGNYTQGSSKLKMTGTGTINYVDDALVLHDLEVTGATTLKGIDPDADPPVPDLRMDGNLTVSGSVASTASETLMIQSGAEKLFAPQALALDGTNDYVACGTSTDYDFTDHFTLAGWAKNDNSAVTSREHIIAKYAGSSGNRIFRLVANGDDMEFTVGYASGGSHITVSYSGIDLSVWHHYAATFDGGVMKLYVDGVLVTNTDNSGTLTAIHANNSRAVEIGSYAGGSGNYWQGNLADIRIYNAVLDATEVATLADNILPNQARTDNLISHWKLDTAAGTSSVAAANSGTGGNAGTVTNSVAAPWVGNKATALANLYKLRCRQTTSTLTIPELTTKTIQGETNGSTIKLTGDVTGNEELYAAGSHTLNVNGNTITVKELDIDGTATLDLRNSTVDFSVTSSGDSLSIEATANLLTGNTTITGHTGQQTPATLPEDGNFEVVGDVSDIKIMSDGDLTVIGSVTNCLLQTTEANIRQWHHTLDTQQLLDADENRDDDLRLTKPALDNAHELMTK